MPRRKQHEIVITASDARRLQGLIEQAIVRERDKANLEGLQEELERAELLDSEAVPDDVVTIDSCVRLQDLDTGAELTYTLVMPADASIERKRVSVLAPVGIALIGQRRGDVVEVEVPAGKRKLKIQQVLFQPEAAEKIA
jgi:regulator of nucleoside diphosphate kinase